MELVEYLVNGLGVSARQAEGGAGLLLGLAQQRMPSEAFVLLTEAIPAISDVISKAPRVGTMPTSGVRQSVSRWFGGLGGLLPVVEGFEQLGCDQAIIGKFASKLTEFFRGKAGDEVAAMIQIALR